MAKVAPTHTDTAADVLAIFGISGDLAEENELPGALRASRPAASSSARSSASRSTSGTTQPLRRHAHDSIVATVSDPDEEVFARLAARLSYAARATTRLPACRQGARRCQKPLFIWRPPSSCFGTVVDGLGKGRPHRDAHVVIEKPFGHDLQSARRQRRVCVVLTEDQILRIDHYLGKEPVMDITPCASSTRSATSCNHPRLPRADDDRRELRGRRPRPLLRRVGPMRGLVIQNHGRRYHQLISIADKKLYFSRPICGAHRVYVRGGQHQGSPASRTWRRARRPRPSPRSSWRSTTTSAPASDVVISSEVTIVFKRPPSLGIGHGRTPEPNKMTIRVSSPCRRGSMQSRPAKRPSSGPILQVLFERVGEARA